MSYSSPIPAPTTLNTVLATLQGFEKRLLNGIVYHLPMQDICNLLKSTDLTHILAATDGGSKLTTASFGWTLRRLNTDLISCSGPVDGLSLTSFRAESYGFASFVLFLSIFHKLHPLPLSTLVVYLDSESLIKRIQQHLSLSYTTPSHATSCDQDVLLIVYRFLSLLPI